MVLTSDKALADRCRDLRNLCFDKERRYIHDELGWNFRMSNVQAAIGGGPSSNALTGSWRRSVRSVIGTRASARTSSTATST